MKKIISLILAVMMAMSCASLFVGCVDNSQSVNFWVMGSSEQLDMYTRVTDVFNETYGKEHGIYVAVSQKPNASYEELIKISASSTQGPDVMLVADAALKTWIVGKYFGNIQQELDAAEDVNIDDIMDNTLRRLRYDEATNTSNLDDPLYGMPIDAQPTALYYNKTMLEKAGIIVISVDAEDLEAFNAGTKADNTGKTKAQLVAEYKQKYPQYSAKYDGFAGMESIPAKGFFREIPYFYNEEEPENTEGWQVVDATEVLIFNNRIAMNWDEVEDVSMLFTGEYNPKAGEDIDNNPVTDYGTNYGYFTEWWFNYGWSVGGDCLNDLTGEGDWNFSLLDPNPNFVVMDGTFTGDTGTVYNEGDTIGFVDKMNINKVGNEYEVLTPIETGVNAGDYAHAGDSTLTPVGVRQTVLDAVEAGTLVAIPSTRDAFNRYLKLGADQTALIDGEGGLDISPNPNTFSSRTSMNYFFSGKLAFLANTSVYMAPLSEEAKLRNFEWDVAPLVRYKRYTDPSDPYCDEIDAIGKEAGHSNAQSAVIRYESPKKEKAAAFIKWFASREGQAIRASLGFFPNQKDLLDDIKFPGYAAKNAVVFAEALEYQGPGDWWYMPDHAWVEEWCVDLNAEVRNGRDLSYNDWIQGIPGNGPCITATNTYLKRYKDIERG